MTRIHEQTFTGAQYTYVSQFSEPNRTEDAGTEFPQNLTPDDLPIPDSGVTPRRESQLQWPFAGCYPEESKVRLIRGPPHDSRETPRCDGDGNRAVAGPQAERDRSGFANA
jgi:hypothetical protein